MKNMLQLRFSVFFKKNKNVHFIKKSVDEHALEHHKKKSVKNAIKKQVTKVYQVK